MKYSRKQIEKGFKKWETETRLSPSSFISQKEVLEEDADTMAVLKAETLIDYINN